MPPLPLDPLPPCIHTLQAQYHTLAWHPSSPASTISLPSPWRKSRLIRTERATPIPLPSIVLDAASSFTSRDSCHRGLPHRASLSSPSSAALLAIRTALHPRRLKPVIRPSLIVLPLEHVLRRDDAIDVSPAPCQQPPSDVIHLLRTDFTSALHTPPSLHPCFAAVAGSFATQAALIVGCHQLTLRRAPDAANPS